MLFSYEARDSAGRAVSGSLEAADERTAVGLVRDQGYYVMRVVPTAVPQARGVALADRGSVNARPQAAFPYARTYNPPPVTWTWMLENLFLRIYSGVSLRDLAVVYRQLAALMNAGVPMQMTFDALIKDSSNSTLRKYLAQMRDVVGPGGRISDAMARFPWIFRPEHRAMIAAGEMSGSPGPMFSRIAQSLELEHTLKNDIKNATIEPCITFACVFLLPPLFLIVAPMFTGGEPNYAAYFDQAILPLLTFLGLGLGIYVASKLAFHARYMVDTVMAMIPGIGGVVRLIAVARFCRTLASLYAAGITVSNGVRGAAEACGNAFLATRLMNAIPVMEAGGGIVDALSRTRALPAIVLSMLSIGETTGDIDVMMDKIAEHFEQEAMVQLKAKVVWWRVIITIAVGIKVLFVLVQFYGGYFGGLMNNADPNG
ncbi:MAG: type II secretion system F family protein [Capsulimonadaceae bacterium]